MSGGRLHRTLSLVVPLHPDEVAPAVYAASSLGCALASYFIVLPLREDAAIGLGTAALPRLFVLSLLTALVVAPLVSWLLNRPTARGRDRALRRLYQALAAAQLGFYLLYTHPIAGAVPATAAVLLGPAGGAVLPRGAGPAGAATAWPSGGRGGNGGLGGGFIAGDSSSREPFDARGVSDGGDTGDEVWGGVDYGQAATRRRRRRRRARHLLQIAAGAATGGVGTSDGAVAAAAAGAAAPGGGGGGTRLKKPPRPPPPPLTRGQQLLRSSFYVWVATANLLSVSSIWARCADAFAESGTRLFGIISAGATLGQLGGSVASLALTSVARQAAKAGGGGGSSSSSGSGDASSAAAPLILASAALLLAASVLAPRIRAPDVAGAGAAAGAPGPRGAALRKRSSSGSDGGGGGGACGGAGSGGMAGGSDSPTKQRAAGAGLEGVPPPAPPPSGSAPSEPPRSVVSELLAGFRLVAASEYLLLVCAYLLLTYVVGSLLYFEKALVVSQSLTGPGDRTAFFAWLNSWSAAIIAFCQLFATASLLRSMGIPAAIALFPFICLVGLAVIALRPRPSSIAAVEILRKVVGYAVIRPAREVLFTVVSRREKYSAKLIIDLVVQRAGDSIAAGAFQLLDVHMHLGVGGVAAAGCATCAAWLVAALRLGALHTRLQQDRQKRGGSARHKQEV